MRFDLVDPGARDITAIVAKLLDSQNKSKIALAIDVSRETLYRWERGESVPNLDELRRLADATNHEIQIRFNVSPETKSLEQQVADLQAAFAVFAAGRVALLDVVDRVHNDDPDVHAEIERIRAAMRRGGVF